MTKAYKDVLDNKTHKSQPIRVCQEFQNLIKDVKLKVGYPISDAAATKIIYNGMVFDTSIASMFYKKKV